MYCLPLAVKIVKNIEMFDLYQDGERAREREKE